MSKKIKGIIWLIVIVLLTAGCSQTSNFGQSVQEFFGFNRPTATPVPAPANPSASQNHAQPEADPFGTSQSGGSSMANLGWDDLDPALIEPEDPGTGTKSSGEDNWEDDPYACPRAGYLVEGIRRNDEDVLLVQHDGTVIEHIRVASVSGDGYLKYRVLMQGIVFGPVVIPDPDIGIGGKIDLFNIIADDSPGKILDRLLVIARNRVIVEVHCRSTLLYCYFQERF